MMKIASVAALSVVAAADVPVFSSNDDYDEINLNIRLLSANNGTVNASHKLTGSLSSTYNTALSVKNLCNAVDAPTCTALTAKLSPQSCTIDRCAAAASRRQLSAADVAITQAYELGFSSAAAASAASTTISGAGFAAEFATELNSALTAAGSSLTATVQGFTAPVDPNAPAATTEAPAPAPAAPAPASSSSDASMVKAGTAIAAAVFASLF